MTIESVYQRIYSDYSKSWHISFTNQQGIKITEKQAKELIKLFSLKKGPVVDLADHSNRTYYKL